MKNKRETPQNRGVAEEMAEVIKQTLADFDVPVEVTVAQDGYRNYRFMLKLKKPVRMRVVKSFEDDLRYALGYDKVEIDAPIPGLKMVGINIPKKDRPAPPLWKDAINTKEFIERAGLAIPLGITEMKDQRMFDITLAPHLLVAGATGSGKSGVLHSFLNSYIAKLSPEELRLILIDTKQAELILYKEVPHLIASVITEQRKAVLMLKWLTKEMERRFNVLEKWNVRDVDEYHQKVLGTHGPSDDVELMPYIILVIDEIADMMSAYPKEIENSIVLLAQMGRAVGIHMIIATQRPSANVVTGLMKANIPARIGLQVASNVDSRIILDQTGAEKLSGPGDLLFIEPTNSGPPHLQSYYISPEEIKKNILQSTKKYGEFSDMFGFDSANDPLGDSIEIDDDVYEEAKELVITTRKVSTSFLQRRLGLGYARAARLMDMLEANGVIGPGQGAAPRKVLITPGMQQPRFSSEMQDEKDFVAARELVIKMGKASVMLLHKELGFSPAHSVLMLAALEFFKIIGPEHGSKPRKVLFTPASYKKTVAEDKKRAATYAKSAQRLIDYCRKKNRVCPMPLKWVELWELLPDRKQIGAGWEPAVPLILAAWGETSDVEKARRLYEHIRWAEKHGILPKIDAYIRSLKESEWHHVSK